MESSDICEAFSYVFFDSNLSNRTDILSYLRSIIMAFSAEFLSLLLKHITNIKWIIVEKRARVELPIK